MPRIRGDGYTAVTDNQIVEIGRAETAKDWLNVLWNECGYQTVVTHTGAATSCFVAENSERIDLNPDKSGVVYIRDAETGDYFSPGGFPCGEVPSGYSCTHAGLYSRVCGRRRGIWAEVTFAVHPGELCELRCVTIRNLTERERRADVILGMVFDLGGYPMPFYYNAETTSATQYVPEANAVLCLSRNPYGHLPCKSGFVLAAEAPVHTAGNLDDFTGRVGSLARPRTLETNRDLPDTFAAVKPRCGFLQHGILLGPGEEKKLYYALGFVRDRADLVRLSRRLRDEFAGFFDGLGREKSPFMTLSTRSPSPQIDLVLNGWAQKQVMYCSIGKKAVRDNAQLAAAALNFDPASCKHMLAECFAHQYADGHATLLWYPVSDPSLYSDPAFWLVSAAIEYLKETGEGAFLEEVYPYEDGGAGSVREHIDRAIDWYTDRANYGPNGLFKIFRADWNDALNIPDEDAESVFMSECVCYLLREAAGLCRHLGESAAADRLEREREALAVTVNRVAFNGQYYIRAISRFGRVGDRDAEGGAFYFNAQSWALLAGIVPPSRLPGLLRSMDEHETEEGVALCVPPYPRYDERVGRMSGMLPGVYENGGIYNHAGCFKVMADCALGRGENAVRTFLKILPDGRENPSSHTGLEPYVFSNCYLKHPAVDMKVASSWQTGTSAWGLRCYYEGILGIRRTYEGLEIRPCLPESWQRAEAVRPYRGSTLHFRFLRRGGGGTVRILLDGRPMPDERIPARRIGKPEHTVTVFLGEGAAVRSQKNVGEGADR